MASPSARASCSVSRCPADRCTGRRGHGSCTCCTSSRRTTPSAPARCCWRRSSIRRVSLPPVADPNLRAQASTVGTASSPTGRSRSSTVAAHPHGPRTLPGVNPGRTSWQGHRLRERDHVARVVALLDHAQPRAVSHPGGGLVVGQGAVRGVHLGDVLDPAGSRARRRTGRSRRTVPCYLVSMYRAGVLELAILGFLAEGPLPGHELRRRITHLTGYSRPVSDGTLYPAINRLTKAGLIERRPAPGGGRRPVRAEPDRGRTRGHAAAAAGTGRARDHRLLPLVPILAFLSLLPDSAEQHAVLRRRLDFLEAPASFFYDGDTPLRAEQVRPTLPARHAAHRPRHQPRRTRLAPRGPGRRRHPRRTSSPARRPTPVIGRTEHACVLVRPAGPGRRGAPAR